jgi:ankyrin repeat protein
MSTLRDVLEKYQSHPEFLGLELVSANQKGALDSSPLHIAARTGEVHDIEVLVAHGADVNLSGDLGNTPLHQAAMVGKAESVRQLLLLGADPSLRNEFQQTPLEVARLGNHAEVAKLIAARSK